MTDALDADDNTTSNPYCYSNSTLYSIIPLILSPLSYPLYLIPFIYLPTSVGT